jgi:hypothetical protein
MHIKIVGCKIRCVRVLCIWSISRKLLRTQKCFFGISLEQKGMLLSNFKYISKILLVISNPNCYKIRSDTSKVMQYKLFGVRNLFVPFS